MVYCILCIISVLSHGHTQNDPLWSMMLRIVFCKVQSLALRTHLPGALATAQNIQIKPPLQGQTLVSPLPKMSICPLKSTQLSQNLVETSRSESQLTDVTQPPSAQPHIPPCKSHFHLHYFDFFIQNNLNVANIGSWRSMLFKLYAITQWSACGLGPTRECKIV